MDLGQYFTTDESLKEKLFEFIMNNPSEILEPSIGRGDLVYYVTERCSITFDMYEIDKTIKPLKGISKKAIKYGDFLEQDISKMYKTIIGNPPYVKIRSGGNLYIKFTEKCYNLLQEGGELIFIVPSDFFKLTSASGLLNDMMMNGTFTHIYHPHDEHLFENATIDIVVYRYCKDSTLEKRVLYNGEPKYISNSNGLITFNDSPFGEDDRKILSDYFDVYVGMVSGKEEVFKNEDLGNITVLNGDGVLNKYIYIEEYPCVIEGLRSDQIEGINKYLLDNKKSLLERKIRKFDESNWYQWGRNIKAIERFCGEECIYIYNLTRKPRVAFRGKVMYFGGGLLMIRPKQKCDLDKIVEYLNTRKFKENFTFSERFKIGHRALCNTLIPNECL